MSVRPQSFFDFNEIWHVGKGRQVMHEGMQYDRSKAIQSWKPGRFQKLSPTPLTMEAGN